MTRLFVFLFASVALLVSFTVSKRVLVNVTLAKRPATSPITNASHPPPIVSISVCRPDNPGTLQQGNCGAGTFDTHQLVLGPGGKSVNSSGLGVGPVPDEHSTVFAPGTLGNNQDYLFFLSTGVSGHANIGVSVLSGSSGPDQNGQWTLRYPLADLYGWYGSGTGFGPVFETSTKPGICPSAPDAFDETFDMHYASAGSIVKDPTAPAGSMLMVYEGTNACIGNSGGDISRDNNDYISLAIATSVDYGKHWPTYRGGQNFDYVPLPDVNQTQAPNAGLGKWGADVCMGNCPPEGTPSPTPPNSYGRYAVVTKSPSLDYLMQQGVELTSKFGEEEISGFVDDASPDPTRYLYVNWGAARIARAQLNGGNDRLTFFKWNGGTDWTTSPGIGGDETNSSMVPSGAFENCGDVKQKQFGGSVSYVEETHQYLLTFVCVSTGDPQGGPNQQNANKGAAWFYATSYDISDPTQFTRPDPLGRPQPREIDGTWSDFEFLPAPVPSPTASPGPSPTPSPCPDYKGYYPSFMSLDKSAGHISLNGYVFYLWGCQGGGTPDGRQMSSRSFKITTTDTTAPVTTAAVAGPLGLNGWYTGPTTVSFSATDDLSGVVKTEYSLDSGVNWTSGSSLSLTASGIYSILFRSTDLDDNVESPGSITIALDSKAPVISEDASPAILLANTGPIQVKISGKISDNLSGVNPGSTRFAVHDEYGKVQPTGLVTIDSNGNYSFTVSLRTFVKDDDKDGRLYTIRVSAADNAGNTHSGATMVTVKPLRPPPPPPCQHGCV